MRIGCRTSRRPGASDRAKGRQQKQGKSEGIFSLRARHGIAKGRNYRKCDKYNAKNRKSRKCDIERAAGLLKCRELLPGVILKGRSAINGQTCG